MYYFYHQPFQIKTKRELVQTAASELKNIKDNFSDLLVIPLKLDSFNKVAHTGSTLVSRFSSALVKL